MFLTNAVEHAAHMIGVWSVPLRALESLRPARPKSSTLTCPESRSMMF
ncbi:hypothetical protein WME94_26870 [Sorangium sp. So ce429]